MLLFWNELYSSTIVALLVTAFVWFNLPRDTAEQRRRVKVVSIKAFILSFCISFAIFYFLGDNGSTDVYENIMIGDPDF